MSAQFRITTLLMFEGRAEEAMRLYAAVFQDAQIEQLDRYHAGEEAGAAGTIKHARLGAHPFSRRFGWLTDRFGVSWQLSLA